MNRRGIYGGGFFSRKEAMFAFVSWIPLGLKPGLMRNEMAEMIERAEAMEKDAIREADVQRQMLARDMRDDGQEANE